MTPVNTGSAYCVLAVTHLPLFSSGSTSVRYKCVTGAVDLISFLVHCLLLGDGFLWISCKYCGNAKSVWAAVPPSGLNISKSGPDLIH